jgi:hypothetical protein
MEVLQTAFNSLVSPITWIPGIGAAALLTRLRWYWRALAAAAGTFVVGLGFAVFLTPGDPGNLVRLAGTTIAGGLWAMLAVFVIWGTQPGRRD